MARNLASAVVGYVVIFATVFLLMSALWYALGIDGAFQQGVWEVTRTWLVLMLLVSLVAAVGGGWVTAAISEDSRGPKYLIGIVIGLGILFAIPVLMGDVTTTFPRPDAVSMLEAMQNGIQPAWVALLNPILGALGVWLGMRLRAGGG